MGKKKIFNDPVYGFISFNDEIIYDLIDHPYFQRLRRISQMGLSHFVYPGALHTRFHHALGALHLMTKSISTLRDKGIEITAEEAEAASIAILLHDIGHGPFSHALEGLLIPFRHEDISLAFMHYFNDLFPGRLTMAIEIFKNRYHKQFLHQLVSSQLDMDRMDYLNRDSFFTGVAEGVIGYDRIIKMLNVVNDHLVVEEKGIYSIEKFLMSRRLMYWQVYLHKTSIAAEQMLILFTRTLLQMSDENAPRSLRRLADICKVQVPEIRNILSLYAEIDDIDIMMALKMSKDSGEKMLKFLSTSILERKIFHIHLQDQAFPPKQIESILDRTAKALNLPLEEANKLIIKGSESNLEYNINRDEIKILMKNGDVMPFSNVSEYGLSKEKQEKHFLCFPRY